MSLKIKTLSFLSVVLAFSNLAIADEKVSTKPAEDFVLPSESEFTKIEVFPTSVKLRGLDDAIQMVITGTTKSGMLLDLTTVSQYEAGDGKTLRVTPSGRVVPLANGSSTINVSFGSKKLQVSATTSDCDVNLPINFTNQIVPIFTKLTVIQVVAMVKQAGKITLNYLFLVLILIWILYHLFKKAGVEEYFLLLPTIASC